MRAAQSAQVCIAASPHIAHSGKEPHLDTVHCVAREQEVVNRDDAVAFEIECNEVSRRLKRHVAIIYQHRRATIDGAGRECPLVAFGVTERMAEWQAM
jgi:hypothetical protein